MKKFISVILAMMIAMSTSIVALALDGDPDAPATKYEDHSEIDLAVIYKLLNDNKKSPAETLTFTITKESVSDSLETVDSMPMFAKDTVTMNVGEGAATALGGNLTTKLELPTYNNVGVYTYRITQKQGTTGGVVYDNNPLFLKVTVVEKNGKKRIAAIRYLDAITGNKNQGFTNEYQAGNLQFSKTVTGNMGEKDRYFPVDVTLTADATKTYPITEFTVTGGTKIEDGTADATTSTISLTTDPLQPQTKTFWIKDGETITISDIPYGVTYTVVEKDPNANGGTNYEAPQYAYENNGTNSIDTETEIVRITNTKNQKIDTGVNLESLPYIALIGFAAVGLVAFIVIKKRKAAREDY